MTAIASIALSGLNAASSRLATAAHNIANARTPGFRRQVVAQAAQPDGGVATSIGRAAEAGDALTEDAVTQMSAPLPTFRGQGADAEGAGPQARQLARRDGLKAPMG